MSDQFYPHTELENQTDQAQNFSRQSFAQLIEQAPLGVYLAQEDRFRLIPASTSPLIIPHSKWSGLVEDGQLILQALEKLVAWLRQDQQEQRARALFGELRDIEWEAAMGLLEADQGLAAVRLDLFFAAEDIKVIEVNATIPAMQAYSDMIAEAYLKSRLTDDPDTLNLKAQYQRQSNTRALLSSLLEHYKKSGGTSDRPKIAIVAREGDSQLAELLWLRNKWQEEGYPTVILQPDELRIRDQRLYHGDIAIDLVYRHIFAQRLESGSDFYQALRQSRHYRIFNPVAAHYEVKGLLAEISRIVDEKDRLAEIGLSETECQAIKRRVPFTRLLTSNPDLLGSKSNPGLIQWVKENQRQLVLKSNTGYGGHRVVIGENFDQDGRSKIQKVLGREKLESWSDFVELCDSGEIGLWIVQEKVSGRIIDHTALRDGVFQKESSYIDCSLFASTGGVSQQYGGAVRFANSAVVNIGTGGGLVPFFPEGLVD